jgi:hypothetical protein
MSIINSNHSTFKGDGTVVNGNHCRGRGKGCVINGNHCYLEDGDCATINGNHCTITCKDPGSIVNNGRHNIINGKEASSSSGGGTTVTVNGRVISPGTSSTITINNSAFSGWPFTSGPATITFGGPATVSYGGIAATHSYGDVVRTIPEPKPEPKPVEPALPVDHKCRPAEDGEQACTVCFENRVDAVLLPCTHTNLCVDCAKKIYNDTHSCPTCRTSFTKVIGVVIGGSTV